MFKLGLFLFVGLVVLAGAYVRLAPSHPDRWHVAPLGKADRNNRGSVFRVIETGPNGLARLDAIARETPRTRVLAGSVDDGMVTYITRTRVIGFPDYTTAMQDGNTLRIRARLRFGRSDFGVNQARVDGWLALLQP
ncbi:DUF1499 domain-containing protein [Ruegeria arenilitoris]|uniref:DUF1499 domain-containing protein n=1 Tax=Ruegeria arenilitoris TaxID=1173585 RepID=UPI001481827E|nr:DUF1499 domain-containing protein [Ruegeria arenilitoris]